MPAALAGAAVPIPMHPIAKARLTMQRATQLVDRLNKLRNQVLGERPPGDAREKRPEVHYPGGELGSLEEMTGTLDLFLDDAETMLSQLEGALVGA